MHLQGTQMLACLVRSACIRGDEDYCEPVVVALRFEETEMVAGGRVEAIVVGSREGEHSKVLGELDIK